MLIQIDGSQVALVPAFHRLPDPYELPTYIASAVASADVVFFERNLEQELITPRVVSAKVSDLLSDLDFARLRELWVGNAIGRNVAELETLSAGDVAAIVDDSISQYTFRLAPEAGHDHQIWNRIAPDKRRWIESDEHLALALSIYPESEQVEELLYALDIARRRRDFQSEFAAWEKGDAGQLAVLADSIYSRTPTRAEAMLGKRNGTMLRSVEDALLAGDRAVFVIGAAHFVGTHGLLEMFRGLGRGVTIVSSTVTPSLDAHWKQRLATLLAREAAAPAICMQGGGARGGWAAGVLAGLLAAKTNTTPSSIWGTSAGALNALWSTAPEVNSDPDRLLAYWTKLACRMVIAGASVVTLLLPLLYLVLASSTLIKLALISFLLCIVLAARQGLIRRLPGVVPVAVVRRLVPKPKAIAPRWFTYMCVANVDNESRPAIWAASKRGWFQISPGNGNRSAEEMSSGTLVDAFDVAVASSSLPGLVRPSQIDGMSVLDGGLVANLPAGFIETNGSAGGGYVICIVPRAIEELALASAVDCRTLNFLASLRTAQTRAREASLDPIHRGGPVHGHTPVFVLTPSVALRSGLYRFWPPLIRNEFVQGRADARAFVEALRQFANGGPFALEPFLLESHVSEHAQQVCEPPLAAWRLWVNTRWR